MSTELEEQLRATLATHAQDTEGRTGAGLVHGAIREAGRMRRVRRIQLAAGVALVAVVAAAVPILVGQGRRSDSLPAEPPTTGPTAVDVSQLAADTGTLLATGMTIVDGARDVRLTVPERPAPASSEYPVRISQVLRANPGYFAIWGPDVTGPGIPQQTLTWMSDDGSQDFVVGHPDFRTRMMVSADGTLAAFSTSVTPGGDTRLVLVSPPVDGWFGSVVVPAPVHVLAFAPHGVWFEPADYPGGPPVFWDLRRANEPPRPMQLRDTEEWRAQSGTTMIVFDTAQGSGYTLAYDVSDPTKPSQMWRERGTGWLNVFDDTGDSLLQVTTVTGESPAVALDSRTGTPTAEGALEGTGNFSLATWNGTSWVVFTSRPDESLRAFLITPSGAGLDVRSTDHPGVQAADIVVGVDMLHGS